MPQSRILIVDDDPHIREVLIYALSKAGLDVIEAKNGEEGLQKAQAQTPDVIVLDVMMPELSGLEMCRTLRQTSQVPILFLSSRDSELDRILGLEMGGDDYVTKPFSPRELVARVKAMLRRQTALKESMPEVKRLTQGKVLLNLNTYEVFWQALSITLTLTEFNLLHTFLLTPQKVFTRDDLAQAEIFRDIVSDRTIDSHIRRLRQKFSAVGCENLVETIHGFGYKLGVCE